MLVKTKAIVLSSLKYQEKSLIVKCFTQSDGLKSYFVPSAYSNKKANQKIAYFQPLTIIEIEANHKNKGTLEYFKEVKLAYHYQNVNTDIVKSSIVFFLSEVLHNSIYEEEKNEELFSFLETSFMWLDTHDSISNFHFIFLLELSKFLGFYPQIDEIGNDYFDIHEGVFSLFQNINCLSKEGTQLFRKQLLLTFENCENDFNRIEKKFLLKTILDYYSIHLQCFRYPKSLDILNEVFL